jgi:hypothetical protein
MLAGKFDFATGVVAKRQPEARGRFEKALLDASRGAGRKKRILEPE